MGQNQFSESLVEMMLSWMRWLTSWFWNIVNSGGVDGGGFLQWFSDSWLSLAIFLIIVGAIVDWIIWMIRWRPHWLWLRKRQIIYEEVPAKKSPARPQVKKKVNPRSTPALHRSTRESYLSDDEYDDPFAGDEADLAPHRSTAALDDFSDWDTEDDPYADDEE